MDPRPWHKFYDPGVPVSVAFEDLTLYGFLERSAQRFPDRPAVVFRGAELSYRELLEEVNRLAHALRELGVERGTAVAIQLPNIPQTVIAFYAVQALGAVAVMTNPLYTAPEIEHQWHDADCQVAIVTGYLYEQKLRDLRDRLPIKEYVIASIPEYFGWHVRWLARIALKRRVPAVYASVEPGPGLHFFREFLEEQPTDAPGVELSMDDLAVLQYTGGTTGVSKGAMLTSGNLSRNAQQLDAWFPAVEPGREVLMTALPLFHVFGLTVAMNWGIVTGAALILMPDPRDIRQLVQNIRKHRVTLFPAVPAMFNAINHYPGIEGIDVSSIKACFSGSAPLPEDVQQRFEKLTGGRILEGFGMSETSPVTHVNPMTTRRKIGTIGIPVPNTDSRIVDLEDGKTPLPTGESGELVIKGPQVMKGYWKKPDETAASLDDGWMHTGDIACMDEDGYFRIVGRKKDMIIAGGYNIYPDEVDRVLASHPAILEAATIGVPDPKRGETVKSFVVLNPGATLDVDAVRAFCRESLAPYKIPRQVEFLDELPKSTVLKVLRRELRDRELAKNAE